MAGFRVGFLGKRVKGRKYILEETKIQIDWIDQSKLMENPSF